LLRKRQTHLTCFADAEATRRTRRRINRIMIMVGQCRILVSGGVAGEAEGRPRGRLGLGLVMIRRTIPATLLSWLFEAFITWRDYPMDDLPKFQEAPSLDPSERLYVEAHASCSSTHVCWDTLRAYSFGRLGSAVRVFYGEWQEHGPLGKLMSDGRLDGIITNQRMSPLSTLVLDLGKWGNLPIWQNSSGFWMKERKSTCFHQPK